MMVIIACISALLAGFIYKSISAIVVHEKSQPKYLKPSTYILRKKSFADGSVRYLIEYGLVDEYLAECGNDKSSKILYDDFCGRHQRLADSMKVEKEEVLK